jgi:hypothetical protein
MPLSVELPETKEEQQDEPVNTEVTEDLWFPEEPDYTPSERRIEPPDLDMDRRMPQSRCISVEDVEDEDTAIGRYTEGFDDGDVAATFGKGRTAFARYREEQIDAGL